MDIKNQVMADQPQGFLHKLAGIVPGYKGYMDKERRRDADKILRTQLAHQYNTQRDRLNRVQQTLLHSQQMTYIADVDRQVGNFQRFIDRLSTATYGYSGLFDPIKVEAQDLDQLYAFDMALATGVDQMSNAIGALETAASAAAGSEQSNTVQTALGKVAEVVDDLNQRLNERADLLTSGKRLPENSYNAMLNSINQPGGYMENSQSSGGTGGTGEVASFPGGTPSTVEVGTPTTNFNVGSNTPPMPGMSSMTEGNQGMSDMSTGQVMGHGVPNEMPLGGSAGSGIETASSPAAAPGAPCHDIAQGMSLESSTRSAAETGNASALPGTSGIAPGMNIDTGPGSNPIGGQGQ